MAKTMKQSGNDRRNGAHFARYTLIGFFTVAPLWVTWLVFDFLLGILAGAGTPLLLGAARVVAPFSATLAEWLRDTSFQRLVAVILILALLAAITGIAFAQRAWVAEEEDDNAVP